MADYAKKTVAELTEILKSRGLPSSGKKAELIARLNEDDKQAATQTVEEPAAEPESVDPPTAGEPAPAAQPEAEVSALAEGDAAAASGTDAAAATTTDTEAKADSTTYTLNLKASDLDSEIAKRKARAERFGTATTATTASNGDASETTAGGAEQTDPDAAALRNLERAKRFGTETAAISKLDEALPTERIRGNKRKADDSIAGTDAATSAALDDPGLKRSFANRTRGGLQRGGGGGGGGGGRFRNRGGSNRGGGPTNPSRGGISKNSAGPAYTNDKDRAAAEARKKKFATA